MTDILNLKIFSPNKVIMSKQVQEVSFEDKFGAITILPRHQDYVSSFKAHLASYKDMEGERKFIILSDGILIKIGRDIRFSVYSAVIDENLKSLKKKVFGFDKRRLNIKANRENRIENNLKDLEDLFLRNE